MNPSKNAGKKLAVVYFGICIGILITVLLAGVAEMYFYAYTIANLNTFGDDRTAAVVVSAIALSIDSAIVLVSVLLGLAVAFR
jgi:hypothetical protein